MSQFKSIDKNTDLSNLSPMGWDAVVHGINYDVYNVEGYIHTVGGRWGENSLWACPSDVKPTHRNMVAFLGEAPLWGISFDKLHYHKTKWGETSVEVGSKCHITRNGKPFYEITGRDMSYCLSKAQYYLVKLQEELPLNINFRNWEKEAEGRKIWYYGQPAIISKVLGECRLLIVPDNETGVFETPAGWTDCEWGEYKESAVTDLLSNEIDWYRK